MSNAATYNSNESRYAIYQVAEMRLVAISFIDRTVQATLWDIENERPIQSQGRIYASEVDAAACFIVVCATNAGKQAAFFEEAL